MSSANKALPSPIAHRSGYKPNAPEVIWDYYEEQAGGCWVWTKSLDRYGYAQVSVYGKQTRAHQVAYLLTHGEYPANLTINHKCAVRHCINPDHLELMTRGENTRDAAARQPRPIECKYGHRNYGTSPSGYRWCRTCDNEKKKRRKHVSTQ